MMPDDDVIVVGASGSRGPVLLAQGFGHQSVSSQSSAAASGGVIVQFFDETGRKTREKPWTSCCTLDVFFAHAFSGGIISSLRSALILAATVDDKTFVIQKGDEDDFDELCKYVAARSSRQTSGGQVDYVVVVKALGWILGRDGG
jgi:hypothetical protein